MSRPAHSIDEIKDMLLGQVEAVVHHYAPEAQGHYTDKGRYFTLNPGRADRSVGSFCVHLSGPKAGRWNDYATGEFGDIIDLIRISISGSPADAIREARGWLGLDVQDPALQRRREEQAKQARQRRAQAEKDEREKRRLAGRRAHQLWLSGTEGIGGTPVEQYLQGRGIDLRALGRAPRALRFHPGVFCRQIDDETGEVIDTTRPAMLALIHNGAGKVIGCHRTYLAQFPGHGWKKAPVPQPKKVLGSAQGGWINLWTGTGPRGGKAGSIYQAEAPVQVFVAEGIEDALSAATLLPEARHIAAISLNNFQFLALPDTVTELTIVADADEHPEAREALERAIAVHKEEGRLVRVWRNTHGGKDLNDALRGDQEGVA